MCEASVQNGSIVVNHSKLQSVCEEVLATVRINLDKFRGIIDDSVIGKYEKASSGGSINFLQDKLIDELFHDEDGEGLSRVHKKVTLTFGLIANVDSSDASKRIIRKNSAGDQVNTGWCVEKSFAELSHYSTSSMNTEFQFAHAEQLEGVATADDVLSHLMMDAKGSGSERDFKNDAFRYRHDFYLQNSANGKNDIGFRGDTNGGDRVSTQDDGKLNTYVKKSDLGEGIMMKLNEVIASYVSHFWDETASKIYAPLLEVPANGVLNQAVFKSRGWPDLAAVVPQDSMEFRNSTLGGLPVVGLSKRGLSEDGNATRNLSVWDKLSAVASTAYGGDGDIKYADISSDFQAALDTEVKSVDAATSANVTELSVWTAAVKSGQNLKHEIVRNASGAKDLKALLDHAESHAAGSIADGVNVEETARLNAAAAGVVTNAADAITVTTGVLNILQAYIAAIRANTVSKEQAVALATVLLEPTARSFITALGNYVAAAGAGVPGLTLGTAIGNAYDAGQAGSASGDTIDMAIREVGAYLKDIAGRTEFKAGAFTVLGDPHEILFASTAKAIRTALSETGRNNVKLNIIQSIAEVSPRMKESFKADLPIYCELFSMIRKKVDLLRMTLKCGVGMDRPTGADGSRSAINGVHGRVLAHSERSHAAASAYYSQLLDRVDSTANAMLIAAKGVISELNDSPLYAEVRENSISDYKNANKKLPFMPLSHMSVVLQTPDIVGKPAAPIGDVKVSTRDGQLGYPSDGPGSDRFAYNYATRLILHNYDANPLMDHMPGMTELLESYNSSARGQKKIEAKTWATHVGLNVHLLRFVTGTRLYSPLFGASRNVVDRALFRAADSDISNPTYQMTQELSAVIGLITHSDRNLSTDAVANFLAVTPSDAAPINRRSSMVYNLLELNISAINVHALRSDVPLANIYNYSYTFDTFVSQIVESSADVFKGIAAENSTHDVMSVICKHPYAVMLNDLYTLGMGKIARGQSSLDTHGRPKFISDQLWNKALLNSVTDVKDSKRRRDVEFKAPADGKITYIKDGKVVEKDVGGANGAGLRASGYGRFNTKFIRNLLFLANVQRMVTHKLNSELTKVPYPVATGVGITNRKLTDFNDLETMSDLNID
jgi:hypothetical protein